MFVEDSLLSGRELFTFDKKRHSVYIISWNEFIDVFGCYSRFLMVPFNLQFTKNSVKLLPTRGIKEPEWMLKVLGNYWYKFLA